MQFLIKLNRQLTYDTTVVLLGAYPEKGKTCIHTKTCTQMVKAACFVTVKSWKWSRCPSIGRLNKQWYIHTTEHSLLSNTKEWTIDAQNNLDESRGNYTEWKKPIPKGYRLYNSICHSWNDKMMTMENRLETESVVEGKDAGVITKGQLEGSLRWNCLGSWQ